VLSAAWIGVGVPEVARANPASNEFFTYVQPDASTIAIRAWGDDRCGGFENTSGQTIELDGLGFWQVSLDQSRTCATPTPTPTVIPLSSGAPPAVGIDRLPLTEQVITPPRSSHRPTHGPLAPQAAPPWATGTVNKLVIMVQFPADAADPQGPQPAVSCTFTAAQMQANLFGGTASGPGDLDDYYREVSFNALNLVPGPSGVLGCFTVANDKNDYDDGPSSAAALVSEAIAAADAAISFAPYDNDGNGVVDNVAVVYAGCGPDNGCYVGANSNIKRLWAHFSGIGPIAVDGGARTVNQYYISPEIVRGSTIRTIGVFAHEFGHALGLPDIYDPVDPQPGQGVGDWSLMGTGSWNGSSSSSYNGESPAHLDPWSKWFLGWITPTDLTATTVITGTTVASQSIPQAETNPFAIQLLSNPGGPDDWPPPAAGQYFLIENRQLTGFDVGLDGCGLLVWHIDETKAGNGTPGHTAAMHELVDVEEADPPPEELANPEPGPAANVGNRGDAGDPFPGSSSNTLFNDFTIPTSRLYDGSATGIRLRLVSTACAPNMVAHFGAVSFNLQVVRIGSGTGTVTSAPGGISCGADCDQTYPDLTDVQLTPVADADSIFAGWSGDCTGPAATTVTIDEDKTCVARFTRRLPAMAITLTSFRASVEPAGSVKMTWETASELKNAGFNLYRLSSATAGAATKINAQIIPARGNLLQGARYDYRDHPGEGRFTYVLEDVDAGGLSTRHDPITVWVGAVRLYLPRLAAR
jgi:M6 family metalloprotease-like protein